MTEPQPAKARQRIWVLALALTLLGLALTLPRLGDSGLWDPWEPVYAQTAQEMSDRGDWVVPYHRGDPRINRPPLTYWLIGASHAVFGVNETAARLPSALLSVLCALGLGLAFAARGRPWEGILCGAALLTSPQWLLLGRFATLSMPLSAFLGLLLALVIAWPALETQRRRHIALVAAVLLLTLAGMTNWPRGLLLPAWAVLGWAALERPRIGAIVFTVLAGAYHAGQLLYWPWLIVLAFVGAVVAALGFLVSWGRLPARLALGSAAVVALLPLPWFLAVAEVPGELKILNYKYALNLGESPGDHTGPYLFVLHMLALGALPWVAAALLGLLRALRRDADDIARTLGGTLVGTLAFFILAESRMGHFTSVIQPAVAGLAAIGLAFMVRQRTWTLIPIVGVAAGLGWAVWDSPSRILETATVRQSLGDVDVAPYALAAIAAWLLLVTVAWWRGQIQWAVAAVLPAACLSGALAIWVVPALSPEKSTRALWDSYAAERGKGEPLALVGPSQASVFYYSNNAVVRISGGGELRAFLDDPGSRYLIVADSMLDGLQSLPMTRRGQFTTVDRSHPYYTLVRYTPEAPLLLP